MTSMVAQEPRSAADAPPASRGELERERRALRDKMRAAARDGDYVALRAMRRRCAEIETHLQADETVEAVKAARSRLDAIEQQIAQVEGARADLLARAEALEPERNRLAAQQAAVEQQWQPVVGAILEATNRLAALEVAKAEAEGTFKAAVERAAGGTS